LVRDVVADWARWTAGDALVHRDIRADNVAVDAATGSAMLLDWAYAAAGVSWVDLAQLAADIVATGHCLGRLAATDRAYRLIQTLPTDAARFVVALTGMWRIRAATIPDTAVMPTISTWRRERVLALRPLVTSLITDLTGPS
jgi:Ser/Thr protein kinase RdoA (MazF antagonist)